MTHVSSKYRLDFFLVVVKYIVYMCKNLHIFFLLLMLIFHLLIVIIYLSHSLPYHGSSIGYINVEVEPNENDSRLQTSDAAAFM